jgi:hypothetical protein
MLNIRDLLAHIYLGRTLFSERNAAGVFPKLVHMSGKGSFWIEEKVVQRLERYVTSERMAV